MCAFQAAGRNTDLRRDKGGGGEWGCGGQCRAGDARGQDGGAVGIVPVRIHWHGNGNGKTCGFSARQRPDLVGGKLRLPLAARRFQGEGFGDIRVVEEHLLVNDSFPATAVFGLLGRVEVDTPGYTELGADGDAVCGACAWDGDVIRDIVGLGVDDRN